jgi:uncharacterized Zn finger protein
MNNPIIEQSWQQDWLAMLSDRDLPSDPGRLRQRTQGLRVRQLEISAGIITADVYSQSTGNCTVTIELPALTDDQWSDVLDGFVAQGSDQLLADQTPSSFASAFLKAGVSLLPTALDTFDFACSCCADCESLCPPILTVFLAVAEMLADDPWLLLRLRGRDRQALLSEYNKLQELSAHSQTEQSHSTQKSYVYRAGGTAQLDETPALSDDLAHFWGRSRQQLDFQHHITTPHIELVLLRRLGPPAFSETSFDLYDNMAEVYRRVTVAALALAYLPDDLDTDDTD